MLFDHLVVGVGRLVYEKMLARGFLAPCRAELRQVPPYGAAQQFGKIEAGLARGGGHLSVERER